MIGELIDHYRVLELIGRGAMGVVYKALDVNLDRQVAIKVMNAEARDDPDFVERFRQEARMQGALNHPNVAMLFDYFVHDGAPVAVMELIEGESLEQLIRRRGAIPVRESIPIFKQALRGVAAAHRAGIIHRDLKPSNLMVTKDGLVKVMDFGIAKRQGAPGATKVSSTSIGSPLYMAPEQILGRPIDCRTDVYALGLTLYELLSGHRPFNPHGKAEFVVLNSHVNDLPEPPTVYRYGLPQPIVDAVMRSLAKDPQGRFQSAAEFMAALPELPAASASAPSAALPNAAAAKAMTADVAEVRLGPTGTVALANSPPRGEQLATPDPSDTVVFEYAPTTPPETADSLDFDFSASTLLLPDSRARRAAPSAAPATGPAATVKLGPAAAPAAAGLPSESSTPASQAPTPAMASSNDSHSALVQRLGGRPLARAAALVATLMLGAVIAIPHAERRDATLADATAPQAEATTAMQMPPSTEPTAPPAREMSSAAETPGSPATTPTLGTTLVPARPDLAGTWRGEYLDASGRELLRVVSLSISRVYDDGGIEGRLQYAAASGEGECRLHPRGSSYSAGAWRLQLSPEGCSPHYPKELGVPLDFDGVNPRANTLRDGRIEAPTGERIRVRLKRVDGV